MAETESPCRFKSWIKTISPNVTTCTPPPFDGARVGSAGGREHRGACPPDAEPRGAQNWGVFIRRIWGEYDRRSHQHRSQEFIRFLRRLDQETPGELDLHLILDNYAAHKTATVKRWVARHPRFHLHFTPTSASWANAVEGFFAQLTNKRLKRGAFRSILELHRAIDDYLSHHNADPKPFVWTKPVDTILHKVARAKQALESVH
jgi:transposase